MTIGILKVRSRTKNIEVKIVPEWREFIAHD